MIYENKQHHCRDHALGATDVVLQLVLKPCNYFLKLNSNGTA